MQCTCTSLLWKMTIQSSIGVNKLHDILGSIKNPNMGTLHNLLDCEVIENLRCPQCVWLYRCYDTYFKLTEVANSGHPRTIVWIINELPQGNIFRVNSLVFNLYTRCPMTPSWFTESDMFLAHSTRAHNTYNTFLVSHAANHIIYRSFRPNDGLRPPIWGLDPIH